MIAETGNTLRPCKHWNREIWKSQPIGELVVAVHHYDDMQYTTWFEPARRIISLEWNESDYDMPNGVTIRPEQIEAVFVALQEAVKRAVIPVDYEPACYGCCRADQ